MYIFYGCAGFSLHTGVPLTGASSGYSSLWCVGFSLRGFCWGAWSLGAGASIVMTHGLSCSEACGIFLYEGSNLSPLHWQAESLPLSKGGPHYIHMFE